MRRRSLPVLLADLDCIERFFRACISEPPLVLLDCDLCEGSDSSDGRIGARQRDAQRTIAAHLALAHPFVLRERPVLQSVAPVPLAVVRVLVPVRASVSSEASRVRPPRVEQPTRT